MENVDEKAKLKDLGYDDFFESSRVKFGLENSQIARVISEQRGIYKAKSINGEYLAKVTGKQMFGAVSREDYPAVGDWVSIEDLGNNNAVINAVLPRKTIIKRTHGDRSRGKEKVQIIATNIDIAFVVESVDRDYNLNRFERYFVVLKDGGVEPVIILNKSDLLSREDLDEKIAKIKSRIQGVDIISTSTVSEDGLDKLREYIHQGKTYSFLGSSGVGKSSLVNKLIGGGTIKTGDVSSYSGRGKHVTTSRQMYFLENGGIVIDNPGMREIGMTDSSEGIDASFDEIVVLARKCKFGDCTHIHEPGCAVVLAVKSGKLDIKKYRNYVGLKKEAEYFEMNDIEKREKDRRFGKFVKNAKKELKEFGLKD